MSKKYTRPQITQMTRRVAERATGLKIAEESSPIQDMIPVVDHLAQLEFSIRQILGWMEAEKE